MHEEKHDIGISGKPLKGAKISILGAGISGMALAGLARTLGADVFLSDAGKLSQEVRALAEQKKIPFEEGGHSARVFEADRILVGSGFPPTAPVLERVRGAHIPVAGELDFVMPYLNGRLIAITGSNGKTTTTSLTGYLLESLGHNVAVTGNIGRPLADIAGEPYDYIVAELSSFQLHWANAVRLYGALVTNLAPDHIDWHGSYENYVRAKARILSFVTADGFSVVQERDAERLGAAAGRSYRLHWGETPQDGFLTLRNAACDACIDRAELFRFCETALLGSHNMENVAMSLAALQLSGARIPDARKKLAAYTPPPHRCSLVATIDGVQFVDDSKGTNIGATVTALSSLAGTKIVILGGKGKGEDYAMLMPALAEHARWCVLIGEEAPAIAWALDAAGISAYSRAADMEEAVALAAAKAERTDVVLLSPACTSWDMYRNYGERGDHFAAIVKRMEQADDAR